MPILDGYSSTRMLREQEHAALAEGGTASHQVVIALTGHARADDRQICIDAGMDDYLLKPFSMQQLDAMLSRWLGQDTDGTLHPGHYTPTSDNIPIQLSSVPAETSTSGAPAPANGGSPLDLCYIDSIRMLDPDGRKRVLQMVVTKFIEETPRLIADIRHAASVSDMEGLYRHAHYLKSSSANLGAVKLAEQCKILESIGRNKSTIEDATLLTRLESEYGAVSTALAALVQGETP